ncbi:glycosyltransferase family 2 protein [Alistipes sp.]|uniref:glycosyltransferase family 2 protein n=1 Tax=Alistipes sp. TaxID=1872444 RepID=UPI003AF1AF54
MRQVADPKISVVIPVYKVEAYLMQCVESVLSQTLDGIEIILVDDESPDACPRMCDALAERHANVHVIHKKNGGLGFARNTGIDAARGEYIAFVDSDDYIDPETYRSLFDPSADAVYFAYDRFDGQRIVGSNSELGSKTIEGRRSIDNFMFDMIANPPRIRADQCIPVSSCCALYRMSIIREYGLRFRSEREIISEDLFFNIEFLIHANRIRTTRYTYYHYRINADSLTQRVRLDRIDRNLYLFEELKKLLASYGADPNTALQRATRLTIGYCRAAIRQVCKSCLDYSEKIAWLRNISRKAEWKGMAASYPWQQMPFVHRIHFQLLVHRKIHLLYLLSRL